MRGCRTGLRAARKGDQPIPAAAVAGREAPLPQGEGVVVSRSRAGRRVLLTLLGTLATFGVLAFVLAGRGSQFGTALLTAPIWLLLLAALLHLASLVTRSEAWWRRVERSRDAWSSAPPASARSRA
jgi:hypothetical protein